MTATVITPNQFVDQAQAWAKTLKDDTVHLNTLSYIGRGKLVTSEITMDSKPTGGLLTDKSRGQINAMLGMPGHNWTTSADCPDDLYKIMMDYKLTPAHLPYSKRHARVMLRKRWDEPSSSGIIRAILSEQYTPLDNFDLIQSVTDALTEQGIIDQVQVFRPEIGDQMRAYYLLPGVQFDTPANDTPNPRRSADGGGSGGLHPAIYLSNDETGGGSVRITGGLYRSYCQNGCIFGWKANQDDRIIHRWNNRRLLAMKAAELISLALHMTETAAQKYIEMQGIRIEPAKLPGIISKWAEKYGIKAQAEDWLNSCIGLRNVAGELTAFDITNELTQLAKRQAASVRELCEITAGDMITADHL